MNIIITGGCGFIGSNLAVELASEGHAITCFDNLSRRGSEVLLNRILIHGCKFVYGDIRNKEDFNKLKDDYDILIECSAEPSALMGTNGDDAYYLINNNLIGSINCFEFCRIKNCSVIFLSTSRVYPYSLINNLKFSEDETRFVYNDESTGVSQKGIHTDFPLEGYRTLYGATKLASEFILKEYCRNYGIKGIINRCGVIAGPWQLGKVDQGVFTFWLSNHFFKKNLAYIGFGGKGKQVRDLLHISDLVTLIKKEIACINNYSGEIFNAGGSIYSNLSLLETSIICSQITGNQIEIGKVEDTRPGDVIWYITDNGRTEKEFNWKPVNTPLDILTDSYNWICNNKKTFENILG